MKFNIQKAQRNSLLWSLGFAILVISSTAFASCNNKPEQRDVPLEERVDSFAYTYFNWQFHKAINYVTPESEKWIRYAASQVHKADLKIINEQEEKAQIEIEEIEHLNDTLARIRLNVHNYMRMDTIGNAGRMIDNARFTLFARYQTEGKKWMIHLTDLPRHEK
ncbi:MAG: hypothetical protein IKW98_09815 [Prevotella sp.]|nr:hypothetical protein [Prevotella sp.]